MWIYDFTTHELPHNKVVEKFVALDLLVVFFFFFNIKVVNSHKSSREESKDRES